MESVPDPFTLFMPFETRKQEAQDKSISAYLLHVKPWLSNIPIGISLHPYKRAFIDYNLGGWKWTQEYGLKSILKYSDIM